MAFGIYSNILHHVRRLNEHYEGEQGQMMDDRNYGAAFGMVILSGCATLVGGSIVFFPKLIQLTSSKMLAGSLGIAAGCMLYVSVAHIALHSLEGFEECGISHELSNLYATISFFSGILLMKILHKIVHKIDRRDRLPIDKWLANESAGDSNTSQDKPHQESNDACKQKTDESCVANDVETNSSNSPSPLQTVAENVDASGASACCNTNAKVEKLPSNRDNFQLDDEGARKLHLVGVTTAVVVALHNFPEGFATFVTALESQSMGLALAFGIAIHNIPEGICIALPIYFASKSKWKAFMWACFAGFAEPLAAFFGYLFFLNFRSDLTVAIAMGLIAGLMVAISLAELIPTAHKYDVSDQVTSNFIFVGFMIIAISQIIIIFTGYDDHH